MEEIMVVTQNKSYPICFEKDFNGLKKTIEQTGLMGRNICIISDSNVSACYSKTFKAAIKDSFSSVYEYTFEPGEKNKNLDTIKNFYDFCLGNKLDRKTVIAGLGGGVCGDMAGFLAATYLRGVTFVQVPTSLLAQVDSSVGGKVGVDYKNSKNVVGAFYQPDFVYINTSTLNTLPKREFSAGMAEVIKYAPIADSDFYQFIKNNKEKIMALDEKTVSKMISRCCEIKADVVSQDEKEGGLREILNFGHTIGHAIETVKGFSLLHGECVGLGMVAVLAISLSRGYIKKSLLDDFIQLLKYFNLPTTVENISAEEVYNQMFFDKKVRNNKIGFILMEEMGHVFRTDEVSEEEILLAINSVLR